jgi:50S ribosomal subunit-associated GTPase HflX
MVDRRTNVSQFDGVNALQKDIERLTKERDALAKERENAQTKLLEEHGTTLAGLKTDLALLVAATKDLPTVIEGINTRLTAQEKWKILMTGYAAAFGIMGAFLGWVTNLIFGVHR